MARPTDHAERMVRARLSLEGLSVGDAFGEGFFAVPAHRWQQALNLRTARTGWGRYTDDTIMAISIVETLHRFDEIEQDDLAERFARRYVEDDRRGYGGVGDGGPPWLPDGGGGGGGGAGGGGGGRGGPARG